MNFLESLLDNLANLVSAIKDGIARNLTEGIDRISNNLESFAQSLKDAVNTLDDNVQALYDTVYEGIGSMVDTIDALYQTTTSAVTSAIDSGVSSLKDFYQNVSSTFMTGLSNALSDISDGFTAVQEKVSSFLKNAVENIWDGVNTLVTTLKEKLTEGYEKLSGFVQLGLSSIWESLVELRERLESLYRELVERVQAALEKYLKPVLEAFARFYDYNKDVAPSKIRACWNIFSNTLIGKPDEIRKAVSTLLDYTDGRDLIGGLVGIGVAIALTPTIFGAMARPTIEVIEQESRAKLQTELLPQQVLTQAFFRGLLDEGSVYEQARRQGISDKNTDTFIEVSRPLPSAGTIQEAYLRNIISEERHDALLKQHGYTQEQVNLFKTLYNVIPPLSDIITMSVREAFSPDIAKRFGQYEDLPEPFVDWARKRGLSREWAERYWAAHWNLPSAAQGFEMLHREVISADDLKLLLRALDVMPFWREKLMAISYSPYTRVDVRRMYQVGLLDYNGVVKAYKDLGYDEEKARNLADFTVRYYTLEDETELDQYRNLTRSIYEQAYKKNIISKEELLNYLLELGYRQQDAIFIADLRETEKYVNNKEDNNVVVAKEVKNTVLDGYKRGLIRRDEAITTLEAIGYTTEDIEWYLLSVDYETEKSLKQKRLEYIKSAYITRIANRTTTVSHLTELGLTGDEINKLFTEWDIDRDGRDKHPTEAQFRAMLKSGLITIEDYEEELRGLGYAERYVELLSKLAMKG